jgi:signal transduction histidine kinase
MLRVVGDLRALIGELRPPGLAEFGLPAALGGYVDWLQRTDGTSPPVIVLDLDEAAAHLPQPLAFTLFRVVQEALRNALRHAAAHRITVRLQQQADEVVLEVSDDGAGFDVPPRLSGFAESGHFGLVGMAERVAQAAGELTVASSSTAGTTLRVRLPVSAAGVDHVSTDSGLACR